MKQLTQANSGHPTACRPAYQRNSPWSLLVEQLTTITNKQRVHDPGTETGQCRLCNNGRMNVKHLHSFTALTHTGDCIHHLRIVSSRHPSPGQQGI